MRALGLVTALLSLAAGAMIGPARALDDEALPPGSGQASEAKASAPTASRKPRRSLMPAQKDAEGTEAPNRFQADTVIKSTYKFEGKTLEVDPD